MKNCLVLLAAICVLACPLLAKEAISPSTHAKPLANDPLKVTIHRLDNGLTVYLSENHQTPRISAQIAIRAGGRHDPRESTGMAHYLEHMLFKGTSSLGTLDWDEEQKHLKKIRDLYEKLFDTKDEAERKKIFSEIDDVNKLASKYGIPNELDKLFKTFGFSGINAYTSSERTVYTVDVPKNRAETWAAIESERFLNPVFRLFQSELETVYEEKNRAMDNPQRALYEAYSKTLYPEHPYAVPILGKMDHLKNPSLEKMYAFYDRYYRPNNMAIALAGDFDSGEMLELVKKYFLAWKPKKLQPLPEFPIEPIDGVKRVNVQYEAEENIIMGWRTVKNGHPDQDALELMDMLVDNSVAGILNLHLNQQQKVKASGTHPDFRNDAGTWQMWGSPKDGQTLEEVEELLLGVVDMLKAGNFEQSDIDAIITDMEVRRKRSFESNGSRVRSMVTSFASYQDWSREVNKLERLKKLTKSDVLRVAKKYLTDNRVVATRTKGKPEVPSIAKPEFSKIPIEPGRKSAFFDKMAAMPVSDIEPKWIAEGKDYEVREGNWGKLVAVKNPVHDIFSLSFSFDRGSRHEKELRYAGRLWNLAGAGDLSAEDFKKKLYGLGSTMNFWVGEQNSGVTLSGLEKNYEETLELARKRFAEPNVKPDDLKKMIVVEMGQRKDNKTNPSAQQGALRQWAQRGDESSYLNDLSNEELAKLDVGRLKELLAEVFDYKAQVTYTGLREPDDVVASFSVGGKKYEGGHKYKPMRYAKAKKNKILFLHRDMVQSKVGMFSPDEKWDPNNWVDYKFYSQYMGGGMSAVLFQEVRESRALAYVVGGGYRPGSRKKDQNVVVGGLGTQADKTIEGSKLVRDLLAELPAEESRFTEVKKAIEQVFRTKPLTYSQIPGAVFHWEKAGIKGGDPRPDRMEAALGYELKDLEKFANRFKKSDWTIYILGNKDRVDMDALGELGEVEMVDLDALYPY